MKAYTKALANFAAGLKYESLDGGLDANFKKNLLDSFGCGLHGHSQPCSRSMNRFVKEQKGKRDAALWLENFKEPCANVALGVGVMIHAFDFDDYHNAKVHPGTPVLPPFLPSACRPGPRERIC